MPALSRLRALPWLALFEVFRTLQGHLAENLQPQDRRRVAEILRDSKGDPRRVTPRQREELRRIARKLDVPALGRQLAPAVGRAASGRRARRR